MYICQSQSLSQCYISATKWISYTYIYRVSPWLSSKESAYNEGAAGDPGSIPELGRSPGGGHGNPLQYSWKENPMDRGAWRATVQRVAQSWTWLKQLSTHIHIYPFFFRCLSHLGHHRTPSRVLCVIQWVPASYLFYTCVCSVRRRQWHPTPVLLPGKSHGWRSLVGRSPWGH